MPWSASTCRASTAANRPPELPESAANRGRVRREPRAEASSGLSDCWARQSRARGCVPERSNGWRYERHGVTPPWVQIPPHPHSKNAKGAATNGARHLPVSVVIGDEPIRLSGPLPLRSDFQCKDIGLTWQEGRALRLAPWVSWHSPKPSAGA